MSKFFFIIFIIFYLSVAQADKNYFPKISSSVATVEGYRVGGNVVRVIRTYTDELLYLELLNPPEFSLIDKTVIDEITIYPYGRHRVLNFRNATAVFFDKIRGDKASIKFQVEFHLLRGGHYFSDCAVSASGDKLSKPVCHHISKQE